MASEEGLFCLTLLFIVMILKVILEVITKAATVIPVLRNVFTIPCHDSGHISVMLVLQSSSDSLHILPSLSSQTNATSDGVCNFSSIEIARGEDEIEEVFMSKNEDVDRGIKQEEIPEYIIFPDIKSEPDELSYICMSGIGHILPVCWNLFFLVMSVFVAN